MGRRRFGHERGCLVATLTDVMVATAAIARKALWRVVNHLFGAKILRVPG